MEPFTHAHNERNLSLANGAARHKGDESACMCMKLCLFCYRVTNYQRYTSYSMRAACLPASHITVSSYWRRHRQSP